MAFMTKEWTGACSMKGMYGVDTMAKGNEKENRTEKLIRELPKGLLKWYPFHENSRTLFVADRTE